MNTHPAPPASGRPLGAHLLEQRQLVPGRLDEVFEFFCDPGNLERITPDFLRFRIRGMDTPELGEGTHIDYSLRVRGLPLRWRSRILEWNPPYHFVDLQVRGPYRTWHHRHEFRAVEDPETGQPAVEVLDRIHYTVLSAAPLLRPLESLVDRLFVRRDVGKIFDHRRSSMDALFPATAT
jgi:hypothetical protein